MPSSKLDRTCVLEPNRVVLVAGKLANCGIAEVNLTKKLVCMERINIG